MAYSRKTSYSKKKRPVRKVVKNQLATKSYVKSLIKKAPELKCHTLHMGKPSYPTAQPIGTMSILHPCALILNETGIGDKIGSKIYMEKLEVLHRWMNPNDDWHVYVRLAVLIDRHPNKTSTTDVFKSTQADQNNPISYVGDGLTDQIHYQWDPTRFQVLADKRMKLSGPTFDPSNPCEKWFKFTVPVKRTFKYIEGEGDNDYVAVPDLIIVWFVEVVNDSAGPLTSPINHSYTYRAYYRDP